MLPIYFQLGNPVLFADVSLNRGYRLFIASSRIQTAALRLTSFVDEMPHWAWSANWERVPGRS